MVLSGIIPFVTWVALPWIGTTTARDAWQPGALWLALTMAFEFLAGHYLFRTPWAELCTAYNMFRGRIWVLVLIAMFLAPIPTLQLRR